MLVATALTLIILLIFAQVFRTATATITQQRGIGQNDARARMMNTILRNDLQKATFRDHPQSTSRGLLTLGIHDDNTADIGYKPIHKAQAGYFYISENDPDNDVDDVLQFTVDVGQNARNDVDYPYVGKASQIARPSGASPAGFNPRAGVGNPDRNQPDFDDGNFTNGATQSRFAEVVYFVRSGILYRRVMLLRDPLRTSRGLDYGATPTYVDDVTGQQDLIPGNYDSVADFSGDTPNTGDFWNDFDVSVHHDGTQVIFHGKDSLANAGRGIGDRLSDPGRRFGFQYRDDLIAPYQLRGTPVEFVDGGSTFMGRFTHEETSHLAFRWPATAVPVDNPLIQTDLVSTPSGAVADTSRGVTFNGPRKGEDIVLTNVDAFDVKLFEIDPTQANLTGRFVDVGHPLPPLSSLPPLNRPITGPSPLNAGKRSNPQFGPRAPGQNNIFDTWHSENVNYGRAPYRLLYENPLNFADTPPYRPNPSTGRTSWDWEPNTTYVVRDTTANTPGSRIFPFQPRANPNTGVFADVGPDGRPGVAFSDDDGDGEIDNDAELGWGGSDDVDYASGARYDGLGYEAVALAPGYSAVSGGGSPPDWIKRVGKRIIDNGILWECFDNRLGIPLIQITVRYRDPESGLSRQLTIQHTLTDRSE
ncbi:MAG: hypothetical protein KDA75_00925 [Planctomycetaceae bacterium]|nr:hypothetical protein [Planctomycetaceae bacterium]